MNIPKIDPDKVAAQIHAMSRQPFRDQVAKLLLAAPTQKAIEELATRAPDRYWQAVAIAARLAGFSDKLEVEGNIAVQVSQLSDAELMAQIVALKAQAKSIP